MAISALLLPFRQNRIHQQLALFMGKGQPIPDLVQTAKTAFAVAIGVNGADTDTGTQYGTVHTVKTPADRGLGII
jgi:hypothetical protein